MIPYPSSSVWYIQASTQSERSEGSGVAIRLRRKGQPGTEETFLLTCSHVVRRNGIRSDEFGPIHEKIWALPAGYGYDDDAGISVESDGLLIPLPFPDSGRFYDEPIKIVESADWAILKFADQKWSVNQDPQQISQWSTQELKPGDRCSICGYPDGLGGFAGHDAGNMNIVRPKAGDQLQRVELVVNGIVTFDGTACRAGMSGGGVFHEKRQTLCGIHLARYDEALQLKAVSIRAIANRLDELGYEPVFVNPPRVSRYWLWGTVSSFLVALLILIVSLILPGETRTLRLTLSASRLEINERGFPLDRLPFPNARITIVPNNFQVKEIRESLTDSQGKSSIELEYFPVAKGLEPSGHFLVKEVPPDLAAEAPFATTEYGAIAEGEGHKILRKTPRKFEDEEEIEISVVSQRDISRYYIPAVVSSLSSSEKNGAQSADSPMINDLSESLASETIDSITETIQSDRPILDIEELLATNDGKWSDLRPTARLEESVCLVNANVTKGRDVKLSGFVVAEDTILTAADATIESYKEIAFDASANSPKFAVKGVLYRSSDYGIALLEVPGVDRDSMPLSEKSLYAQEPSKIAIIGFVLSPEKESSSINQRFFPKSTGKKLMPGSMLGMQSRNRDGDRSIEGINHNATTSIGVMGAPVIDISSQKVVGVHQSTSWMRSGQFGWAIPAQEFLNDPKFLSVLANRGVEYSHVVHTSPEENVENFRGYDPSFLEGSDIPFPTHQESLAPGMMSKLTFHYPHFTVVMDPKEAIASIAACNIDGKSIRRIPRTNDREVFLYDPRCPTMFQRPDAYYRENDWDRGHLVQRSSVSWGDDAEAAVAAVSFYTNITPQHENFNRGIWFQIEDWILKNVSKSQGRATVFAGPIIRATDPIFLNFRIPQDYWKVAIIDSESEGRQVHGWICQQYTKTRDNQIIPIGLRDTKIDSVKVSIEKIESETGWVFEGLK